MAASLLLLTGSLASHNALAAPPPADWSGFYIGANLALHEVDTSGVFDAVELGVTPDLDKIGSEGANLGIHGGYSMQVQDVLLGIEGDLSFGGFDEKFNTIQDGSATEAGLLSYPIEGDLEYLATIRGRLGLSLEGIFHHPVLVFATGGVAFTEFEMDIANGRSEVGFEETGPVWGGGLEVPVSANVSFRADYLHIDFDKQLNMSDAVTSGIFDANDGNFVKLDDVNLFRVGFNLRLN
jgi:outer membrane immunogenic protein